MPNRLVLDGLSEFKQQLRNLPRELAGEAGGLVVAAAEGAKAEIVNAYPTGPQGSPRSNSGKPPGGLKRGVKITTERSAFGASAVVRSTSRHSHLWEFGTQVRENSRGANRGAMPDAPHPTFIPVAQRRRKAMYEGLKDMLRAAGFQVSGDV